MPRLKFRKFLKEFVNAKKFHKINRLDLAEFYKFFNQNFSGNKTSVLKI